MQPEVEKAWDQLGAALALAKDGCPVLVGPYALGLVLAEHKKREQEDVEDAA